MTYPSATPEWLHSLPGKILSRSWGLSPEDAYTRTDMDDGSRALERKFARTRTILSVGWEMSSAQFEVFKFFWKHDLKDGGRWFDCPLSMGGETELYRVRFSSDEQWQARSVAGGIVEVTSELEQRDLPTQTPLQIANLQSQIRASYVGLIANTLADVNALVDQSGYF